VVRQAGGWVEVRSALDRGTRFDVYLPALGVSTVPPVSAARPQRAKGGSVLVCDDEVRLASLTAGLLEQHGFDAQTVTNGGRAGTYIGRGPSFDAVLPTSPARHERGQVSRASERAIRVPIAFGDTEEDAGRALAEASLISVLHRGPAGRLIERAIRARAVDANDSH
jgi:hypothetical protein